jgi:hypothetical protein
LNIHKKQIGRMRIVKWIISLLALSFLYYEILVKHNAVDLLRQYKDTVVDVYPYLILVLLLMPINWMLEAYKWRMMFNTPEELSFWNATKGVLMGVTLGLFTPNGIGEFAGRIWVVKEIHRERAVSSSIAGSLAQLCITITIGGAFVVFQASQILAKEWLVTAQVLGVITVLVGLISYYKMPQIAAVVLSKIKFFDRFENFKQALESFTKRELTMAYIISLIRYGVFCTQLGVLLYAIGGLYAVDLSFLFVTIPIYYYIQTLVPTVALSEIGVRGLILLFLFAGIMIESEVILISFLIWIINLILPGLIGMYFLIRTRFVKR